MPQPRNSEHIGLQRADTMGRRKSSIPRPIGNIGIWNGDFELGDPHHDDSPNPYRPDGWDATNYAGGSLERVTGGMVGNYCMRGGQAGMGAGSQIVTTDYFPVDETQNYYLAAYIWSNDVLATVSLGALCYNANKTYLGAVWPLNTVGTLLAATKRQLRIGPQGDVTWWGAGGTRYARISAALQQNVARTGAWVYLDDVQFRQLTATYSPQITYTSATADHYGGSQAFTLQAYVQHANSVMTLTLTEPGRIWVWYHFSALNTAQRSLAWFANVFINGVSQNARLRMGEAVANYYAAGALCFQSPIVARGTYTIDLRFYVNTAGDTTTVWDLRGESYYVRAY